MTRQIVDFRDSVEKWLTKIARDSVLNAAYEYNDYDGRMTRVNFGTGPHAEYGYDASGALTKITHYSVGGTTVVASVAYDYDLAGNVTTATLADTLHFKGDAAVTYLYDVVNRLTKESCAKGASSYRKNYGYRYWYDAVGNRTKMESGDWSSTATTTYLYSPRNELTKTTVGGNDTLLNYDPRGNLTKKGGIEYSWSSQDQLTKVVNGGTTVEYKYDLLGRRVAKRVNGGEWSLWCTSHNLLKLWRSGFVPGLKRVAAAIRKAIMSPREEVMSLAETAVAG